MGNKVRQIFNLGPALFSFGRQLPLICECWGGGLGPEYGQRASSEKCLSYSVGNPAFCGAIFAGFAEQKAFEAPFCRGL